MDISKLHAKQLRVVIVRSKNRSKLPLAGNIICFVYNTKQNVGNNQYKKGGIARCSLYVTAEKRLQKNKFYLKDKNHRFYEASKRLDIKLSGRSRDIYGADICYHQSCYVKYVHWRSSETLYSKINYVDNFAKLSSTYFFKCKDIKIKYQKKVYFFS